jgi:hypothetical protein
MSYRPAGGAVLVTLTEVPAENMLEGGLILREPGQEQAWFDENSARLTEVGMTSRGGV